MKTIKAGMVFLVLSLAVNFAKAQTIDEGKKFLYYERYTSAKGVFEKLLAANPNNTEAAYWLGQTLIAPADNKDIAGAKALYQKTLDANTSSALLMAGIGHIELLEGKTTDARTHFETAISLSKGKDIAVLNAIGFANGDFDSKNGDPNYAIDKLKQATQIKGFKDPDVYTNLGDAYRKLADGGNAQLSYEAALAIDPNYARAIYRIGRIYQTQGRNQEDLYLKYYNDAIAKDPNYTPVYYTLYTYYYNTNVVKSAQYLESWLSHKDPEPMDCYYRTTIKYAQGLFNDAITQADGCISSGGATVDARLYGIKGYAYDKLGDSNNAKLSFDQFFQKQAPDKIGPLDYKTYALVLLKFPGNEALAGTFLDKAIDLDSTEQGKTDLINSIATVYEARGQYGDAADWYKKILNVKKNVSKTDLFNAGYDYSRAKNYPSSIAIWEMYTTKFPDDVYGYDMKGRAQRAIDTTLENGLANASFQKVIDLGEAQWATDSNKVRTQLIRAYKYFIEYSYNVKKDKNAAILYCDKVLAISPDDTEVAAYKKAFTAAPAPPRPPAHPSTTGHTPPTTPVHNKKR